MVDLEWGLYFIATAEKMSHSMHYPVMQKKHPQKTANYLTLE